MQPCSGSHEFSVQGSSSSQRGGVPLWQVWLVGLQISLPVQTSLSSHSSSVAHLSAHWPAKQAYSAPPASATPPSATGGEQGVPSLACVPLAQIRFEQVSLPLQG